MIKRLRETYTDDQLTTVYDNKYDHTRWDDHIERIELTIDFASKVPLDKKYDAVADLSAGDAAIINALSYATKIIGDFYPGFEYQGKIEDTVEQIPNVDLFILSETLEHVNNPFELLQAIKKKTKYLLVSTPQDNWDDGNPEHYWSWGSEDVKEMLIKAGFNPLHFLSKKLHYTHQLWICE